MNRIASYFPETDVDSSAKQFMAEVRDVLRCRTGLCKHDVFQLLAGWNKDRNLWEISLRLTPFLVWQVGCECSDTVLEMWRELMPQIKEYAIAEGLLE